MNEQPRGLGKDLCGRVHAHTGAECYLPDTHDPRPHHSLTDQTWHDGLCTQCAGSGILDDALCAACNGTAFEPLTLPETYQPG